MSRIKKTIVNARVNIIFYSLNLFISFFSRRFFLITLGTSFLGFTATISNILGFLNLSELGIGTAITYLLFMPLKNHDKAEINQILSLLRYYYRKISGYILIFGLILSFFLPIFFEKSGIDLVTVYLVYYSYLFNLCSDYYFNYKQLLLVADQKNYLKVMFTGSINIIKLIAQIFCLIYFEYKVFYYVGLEVTFNIIKILVLNRKISKEYEWVKTKKNAQLNFKSNLSVSLKQKTKQIFSHQFAGYVINQTDQILIYSFTSLSMVAYYANYNLLIGRLVSLIDQFLNSSSASIGNLIASEKIHRIKLVFDEFLVLRYFLSGIIIFLCYNLVPSIIPIWLGKEYLLNNTIFTLLLFNWYIMMIRQPIDSFLYGFGIFHDTWAPWTEALLNLTISLVAGYYMGVPGILLGTLISLLSVVVIWKPILLFRKGFRMNMLKFWLTIINYIILLFLCGFLVDCIKSYIFINLRLNIYIDLGINALIQVLIFAALYFISLYLSSSGMRNLTKRKISD